MRWRKLIAVGGAFVLLEFGVGTACGASTELDVEEPLTEEDICLEASGTTWAAGDCIGHQDDCDLVVCENAIADGCQCDDPDACWDGERCVPRDGAP
jgi:hypothetical protein